MQHTFHPDALLAGFDTKSGGANKNALEGLNAGQSKAAATLNGAVLVDAGAGTGKTTTMVRRIANLVNTKTARPDQILAVTFTRKAAAEIRGRVSDFVGYDASRRMTLGNFHAVCGEILRRHAPLINISPKFTILDDQGQKDVIAGIALERNFIINRKDKAKVSAFHEQISSWKEEGWNPEAAKLHANGDFESIVLDKVGQEPGFGNEAFEVFVAYQAMLQTRNWCDFTDMILHVVNIFTQFEDVRLREAGRYTHIIVDEFQDSSPVQNAFITLMAKDHGNICVVGDTDQSIYEWRNARPEIMTNFDKNWPNTVSITIDENYRSTQEILDVANAVVAPLRAKDGSEKKLKGFTSGVSPADLFQHYTSGIEEAEAIVRQADILIQDGHKANEIAILCRSGRIMQPIERALRDRRMPYIVAGAMKFTDREEVKDGIAYLALAINPMDFLAFERVVAKPRRGIGPQKVGAIRRVMITKKLSVRDGVQAILDDMNKRAAGRQPLEEMVKFLDEIHALSLQDDNAGQILESVLELSGYYGWREHNTKDPQREMRLENIERLISEAQAYPTIVDFLESMSLHAGQEEKWGEDCVVLSTVHASKGLEFDTVFTPALEAGIFPNARSEKTSYGADEERRLVHVAWTRARKNLYTSFALYRVERTGQGEPSPYLAEAGILPGSKHRQAVPNTGPRRLRVRSF